MGSGSRRVGLRDLLTALPVAERKQRRQAPVIVLRDYHFKGNSRDRWNAVAQHHVVRDMLASHPLVSPGQFTPAVINPSVTPRGWNHFVFIITE